jgi:hypothetical protein
MDMGRLVLGVIIGYMVMFVGVFATFSLAYIAMGSDRAFLPGSYDVTPLWLVVSFVLSVGAALLGGLVALVIGKRAKAASALAVFVLVLGILMAIPTLTSKVDPGPRTADVPNLMAMSKAQQPTWVTLLNPFVGAVGVLAGARLRKQPTTSG